LRRKTGFEAAEEMIAAGNDKALMDGIRRGSENMEAEEHGLMALRDARSKDSTETTLTILPVGALLSLLLITIMLFRLNSEAAQRLKTLNSLKQSEEFNRRVLESSQDRIEVLDLKGNLIPLSEGGDRGEIEWRIKDLPSSEGDPALLKQVWVNLLSNAVKYMKQANRAEASR
jgi:signal transduction histidine kinase